MKKKPKIWFWEVKFVLTKKKKIINKKKTLKRQTCIL